MTGRLVAVVALALGVCAAPAHAGDPTFTSSSAGLPRGTVMGRWSADGTSARLEVKGAVTRAAATTFDAVITFAEVGRRGAKCPRLVVSVESAARALAGTTVVVRPETRSRRAGGRWSAWHAFGEVGVRRDADPRPTSVSGSVLVPSRSCTGPVQYSWRVHGDVDGEVAIGPTTFDLRVEMP